ncbi:MAG: phenylpyruvate tautomerase MIF-related protein [Bacillota bacterium]|nr:phenylpyruvate tautomerase MIF-related protein [Bacillota bacterium]
MPYINCTTTKKLTDAEKDNLKAQMGKLIEILPGKSEDWLFVGFNDNQTLYFRGQKMEAAAVVEVKLFGASEKKFKDELTSGICKALEKEIAVPGEGIYVIFTEVTDGNWGWNGGLF